MRRDASGRFAAALVSVLCALGLGACGSGPGARGPIATSTPSPAASPEAPRSSSAVPYADDPRIRSLAKEMPFPLLVPSTVPGDPPLTIAQVIVPPPFPPHPADLRLCQIYVGPPGIEAGLNIVESNGGPTPQGIPGEQTVTIDAARNLTGVTYIAAYDNLAKTSDRALVFTLDGVHVQMDSTALSVAQLVAAARTAQPVGQGLTSCSGRYRQARSPAREATTASSRSQR